MFRSDGYKRISVDERATKLTGDVLDAISTLAIRGAKSCFMLQGAGPSEAGKTWLRVFQHLQCVGGRRRLSYTEGEAREAMRLVDAAVSLQFAERMESFLLKNVRQHWRNVLPVAMVPHGSKPCFGYDCSKKRVGSVAQLACAMLRSLRTCAIRKLA